MNVNEEMLAGYAAPYAGYPDVDPDATIVANNFFILLFEKIL